MYKPIAIGVILTLSFLVFFIISQKQGKKARNTISDEDVADIETDVVTLSDDDVAAYFEWEEPNRARTPPLHIGTSGERFSTLTGVSWLNEHTMVVNHRSGLRLAAFDVRDPTQPLGKTPIPHLTDDIAARPLERGCWELAVSGCWDCAYSLFTLQLESGSSGTANARLDVTHPHSSKDFCHGVAYDHNGQLCLAMHTGKNPRIEIGEQIHKLPKPWGARDICYDRDAQRYVVVAVSANPKQNAYEGVMTSIWLKDDDDADWRMLIALRNVHSDACDVVDGRIWIPDQVGDRVIAIDGNSGAVEAVFDGDYLDFPHGLAASPDGKVAITNYGSSSVLVFDPKTLLAATPVRSDEPEHSA